MSLVHPEIHRMLVAERQADLVREARQGRLAVAAAAGSDERARATIRPASRAIAAGIVVAWFVTGCVSSRVTGAPSAVITSAPPVVITSAPPVASPTIRPTPVASPDKTQSPGGAAAAAALADSYERALVAGRWHAAWVMLAPAGRTRRGTFDDYASERSAFFTSVAGRYRLSRPTHRAEVLDRWTESPDVVAGADLKHAYIIRADYPALANNNAGYEVFLVAPDASATWRIWEVR